MSPRNYCTYFDHRYLARGLTLFESLRKHSPGCQLWVLCLSEECHASLKALGLPGIRLLTLDALEAFDPELKATRATRSLVEYYFTCSPCILRFVLTSDLAIDSVTYVDSDLYFFSDAGAVDLALGSGSVGITPHRFTPRAARSHAKYGAYNVGLLVFRRDVDGLACLDWWRARCLEWCYDRVEQDRYADQKYLEGFSGRFDGVVALEGAGLNLAPWNLGNYRVDGARGAPTVDGEPVVFFHFQGISRVRRGWFDSNLTGYGGHLDRAARELLYVPYLEHLTRVESRLIDGGLLERVHSSARREARGLLGTWRFAKRWANLGLALLARNLVQVRRA